ncbi:MAG: TrmH family RNA methyltransferase [Beijerinckiaceae bacterium]
MATPIPILTADDQRIEAYRDIRERDLTGRQGLFVAEGEVVLRLMLKRSRFALESVLLSRRRAQASPELVAAIPEDTPLYVAEDVILETIAGFPLHRGILAIGRKGDAPAMQTLIAGLPERAIVVVAIGIANHDNMGGIFRNAAAFGVNALLLDEESCDPLYRKAIRVSVGASLAVPFARQESGDTIVSLLQEAGFCTLALSPSGTLALKDIRREPRMALVLGAEGPGLPEALMHRMIRIRISMAGSFDSLNVATTSGIALHHFFTT